MDFGPWGHGWLDSITSFIFEHQQSDYYVSFCNYDLLLETRNRADQVIKEVAKYIWASLQLLLRSDKACFCSSGPSQTGLVGVVRPLQEGLMAVTSIMMLLVQQVGIPLQIKPIFPILNNLSCCLHRTLKLQHFCWISTMHLIELT